jgi:phosphoglycolate phosphatase
MPAYQAVLFDLDGTLLDTAPDFWPILNALRSKRGLAPLTYEAVRQQVSNGAAGLIQFAFNLTPEDADFEPLRLDLLARYQQDLAVHTRLFPGLDHLLQRLQTANTPWGVVTNKPSRYSEPLLSQLGLRQACSSLICPDHVKEKKPDPEGLLLACQQMQVAPGKVLYVGDHQRDIEAGLRAGMQTAVALFGYIAEEDDPTTWQAHFYVKDSHALEAIIFHEHA